MARRHIFLQFVAHVWVSESDKLTTVTNLVKDTCSMRISYIFNESEGRVLISKHPLGKIATYTELSSLETLKVYSTEGCM